MLTIPQWWFASFHLLEGVGEDEAEQILHEIVGATMIEGSEDLCARYGQHLASSCALSLQRSGPPPGRAPKVRCVTQITDGVFRGALVYTVEGKSDLGVGYQTDLVILNDGTGVKPLDPIFWSGLNLTATDVPTTDGQPGVSWRFDGQSTRCD